ncbi:MAG: hypothetical protein JNM66_15125 [Bryobacterales bacterium]|nr:hypothetical protein [Bryobacterales bacterium]
MELPRIVRVKQTFPDRGLKDVAGSVKAALQGSPFVSRVKPGGRVAIGVGSRGITNIALIAKAAVDFWKSAGCEPFLFPAMGSHGAATAAGQADVLAHYGITEASMGCQVISQLEVVSLGKDANGIEAFLDKEAYNADGVMLVGRVKWHTDFAGKIESGLFKMMAIGLGKFAGAQRYHTYAYRLGLEHVIRSVGRQVLGSGKILGGLAILEDAHHQTAQLTAVAVEEMEAREEELLELTKSWMARVPFDLDILMIDEIGKNISGAGMDTKVANRGVNGEYNPWPGPKFQRIFLRDLSGLSYGNAVGLGMADVIHDRLLGKVDWNPTSINSLTASSPSAVKTPLHYGSDLVCLQKFWPTVGKLDPKDVTLGWIKNTLQLSPIALSENLLPQIKERRDLEILGEPEAFELDSAGNFRTTLFTADQLTSTH